MHWDKSRNSGKSSLVIKKQKQSRRLKLLLLAMLKALNEELANCNKVYDKANNNIHKPPPYIQIRLITAKESETMRQVASVIYTLNEIKDLSQFLRNYILIENCKI